VRVVVKLFAGLRERAGTGTRELELPDGARAGDAWRELELGDEPSGLLYAVNKRYAGRDEALADGDEVALIPPVSGGAFRLVEGPLDPAAAAEEVASPEAGAIATFVGTVRRRSRERDVRHLEYEAYPGMAEAVMEEIAAEAAARHEVTAVAIHHRTGRVEIGEPSVVVAVSARHRAAALAACAETIDALKERVPLWKKEVYEGGEEWLGRGS
jgi:molybdopterin synthase catalytic subunit